LEGLSVWLEGHPQVISVQARFETSQIHRIRYEILWKQVSHENFGTSNHYQEELEGN